MKSVRVAAILTACVLAGVVVRGAVILPADLATLVTGARAVVHGRVVAVEPRWVEGRRRIETLVTLSVEEYLKGNLGDEVTFKVPGGQMGPYRSFMVGAPTFAEGDEVVVFLNAQGPTIPWISGFNQGVFRVFENAAGVKVIVPGISLTARDGPPSNPRAMERSDPAFSGRALHEGRDNSTRERVALSAFTARVKAMVREGRTR